MSLNLPRFAILNSVCFAVAQWLFFWIADPSTSPAWIEPLPVLLNLFFLLALAVYLLLAKLLLRRSTPLLLRPLYLLIAATGFLLAWSAGIVTATNIVMPPNGALFYATSGQQFTEYDGNVIFFCLIVLVPAFGLALIANALGWKWLFHQRPRRRHS